MIRTPLLLTLLLTASLSLSACIPGMNTETTDTQSESEVVAESQELAAAMEEGKPIHCTMTDTKGAVVDYYNSGKKMKIVGTNVSEETETGTIINDGEYMYVWSEGETEGIKYPVSSIEEMQETAENADQMQYDTPDFQNEEEVAEYENRGYTIECDETDIDDSMFIPPSEVTFMDVAALMEQQFDQMKEQMGDVQLPPELEAMQQ